MAEPAPNTIGANEANVPIPIAQLSPDVNASATIKAVVTLIWPYSSSTKCAAFLLADPNFRLRRDGGQVRVQFSGSSGTAVAGHGIGSGDLVSLSLEGVEWKEKDPTTRIPGRSIEWELRYSERLLMEVRSEDSQNVTIIDIDHPTPATEPPPADEPTIEPLIAASQVLEPPTPIIKSRKVSDLESENPEEWQSPAFIKRARTSYGSLFGSSDIFAEDGTVKGKGRKRAKLGWRYTSRSPSPSPSPSPTPSEVGDQSLVEGSGSVPTETPATTDEGCQTIGNGEALVEIAQSGAESIAGPPATFAAPSSPPETNDASNESTVQVHSEGWTALNSQPRDLEANFGSQQPWSGDPTAPVASYVHSHGEGDGYGPNAIQNLADHDGLPDTGVGFGDNLQSPSMAGFEYSDQYGHWQSSMAGNDQLSGHVSPNQPLEYPSPTQDGIKNVEPYSQLNLYYEGADASEFHQNAENAIGTHSMDPPGAHRNGSRKLSMSSHRSRHSSAAHTPNAHPTHGSASRSQSIPHETYDLTGSSDQEGDDADDEDGLGDEESAGDQDGSDVEVDDYGHRVPSWKREFMTDIPEGQIYDEEDEYYSDERQQNYYDDEEGDEDGEDDDQSDRYDEEDDLSVRGGNSAPKGETPIISLLSSDEEEGGNDDGVVQKPSTLNSKPLERPESLADELSGESDEDDSGDSSDVEDEDGEDEDQGVKHEEPWQPSRAPESRDDNMPHKEALDQSYLPRRRSSEKSFVEPRRRSYASFDGASDQPDEGVIKPPKAKSSSPRRVGKKDGKPTQLEKDIPSPREMSRGSSPNAPKSNAHAASVVMKEPSPVPSVKAQILEILATKDSLSEPAALSTVRQGVENEPRQESVPVEEDTVDMIEIAVEQEAIVSETLVTEELRVVSEDTEMTDTISYPELPPREADEGQESAKSEGSSMPAVGASKTEQLPTPDDSQMTGLACTTSFDATQSSVNETQVTEVTTITTSVELDEASRSSPAKDAETAETVSTLASVETSQTQELIEESAKNFMNGLVEKESFSKTKKVEMVIDPHLTPEPQSLPVTPRRSQRQASKALNSPKPLTIPQKASPLPNESLSPEGYDASAELAMAIYNSPSKNDVDNSSQTSTTSTIPTHLKMSLRTDRGEYTVIKQLRIKQNRKPDILAIATTANTHVQQAKKPPKDWFTDFNITDASVSAGVVTRVAIFRPHLSALPLVDPGDGILLRNFKVQSMPGKKFSLRSDSDSSWAIFKRDGEIEMRGPPVVFGDEESNHVASLKEWFDGMPAAQREVLEKAHGKADKGKGAPGGK